MLKIYRTPQSKILATPMPHVSQDPAKTRRHECSSSKLRAAAPVVAPVLWRRFEDGLASICVLIHSCKTRPKKARRLDLTMDESGGWLVGSATDVGISDKVVHCKHFGVLNVELLSTHSVPVRLGAEERVNTADTACIVCGTGSIRNGLSVRLSVPSIDSSSAVRP